MKNIKSLLSCLALFSGIAQAAPIIHTTDFIDDSERGRFNSFENAPTANNGQGLIYTGGNTYIEDDIRVAQITPNNASEIWIKHPFGLPSEQDGDYSWYPNSGDNGYTAITLATGLQFEDVGFLITTGSPFAERVYFELWNGDSLYYSGSISHRNADYGFDYLGFEGGGFDTILIRDGANGASFYDASLKEPLKKS